MQTSKTLIIICLLAVMLAGTALAQVTVVIDNKAIPTEHIDEIKVLKNSNVISISTLVPYTVEQFVPGELVAITSLTAIPSSIVENGSTTISWATVNAVSCAPTGGNAAWQATNIASIGLSGGSVPITVNAVGPMTFTLTCDGSEPSDTDSMDTAITVSSANAVAITSFTALPSSIVEGENTTLSWSTTNATSCAPSGGNAAWQATDIASIGLSNGSVPITISTPDTYNFVLTCDGAEGGPVVESAVVTVNPVATDCPTPTLDGVVVDWDDFWEGDLFPRPSNLKLETIILKEGYKAIKFNTADIIDSGKIYNVGNNVTPGYITGAFSKCPGIFNDEGAELPSCYLKYRQNGWMTWSTSGVPGCSLDGNETYYFNFTYTDGIDPSSTRCARAPCVVALNHVNY